MQSHPNIPHRISTNFDVHKVQEVDPVAELDQLGVDHPHYSLDQLGEDYSPWWPENFPFGQPEHD
jgi:hypothetical protein